MSRSEDTYRFLDGEMSEAEADEYRIKLTNSPDLAEELQQAVQLDALASELRERPASDPKVVRLSWFRTAWRPLAGLAAASVIGLALIGRAFLAPEPTKPLVLWSVTPSEHSDGAVRGRAGDTLEIQGAASAAEWRLRVFHRGRLVLECPGDSRCEVDGDAVRAELTLDLGAYDILHLNSSSPIPPTRGSADEDVSTLVGGDFVHEQLVIK